MFYAMVGCFVLYLLVKGLVDVMGEEHYKKYIKTGVALAGTVQKWFVLKSLMHAVVYVCLQSMTHLQWELKVLTARHHLKGREGAILMWS